MSDEITYDMQPSPLAAHGSYTPLRFRIGAPVKERARYVASLILGRYHGVFLPYTQWRAAKELVVTWKNREDQTIRSRPFRFERLVENLRKEERFVPETFNLPPLHAEWLDSSIEVKMPFHAPATNRHDQALTFVCAPAVSNSFPVQPKLDREGRALSSVQLMLLQSWFDLRVRLVTESQLLFDGYDWLRDLFMYVSTIVSVVDNTLHHLYYRAQYESAVEGWRFNEAELGHRRGRRLKDKLHWVGQITGRPLHDCREEIETFMRIKDLRNHLVHFDPPMLAFTIEDVADWLNATEQIARLLASIRIRINQPLCDPLIRLLLARPVEWYPSDPGKRRVPQGPEVGYASSSRAT